VELLDHRYNLFSPTCFWTLFRTCAAYFGILSDLQEHIDHQGDDTPGSYKHIPITDPLLEIGYSNLDIEDYKSRNHGQQSE